MSWFWILYIVAETGSGEALDGDAEGSNLKEDDDESEEDDDDPGGTIEQYQLDIII